ncbi:MAG: hypothetical protein ACKOA2_06990 [Ilumatobacteraceae bacterium]
MLRRSAESSRPRVGLRRRTLSVGGLGVVVTVAIGCAGSTPEPAPTAAVVCDMLVELDNALAEVANAVAAAAAANREQTRAILLDGFDRASRVVDDHVAAIERLDAADLVDGEAVIDDLRRGAAEARAELVDERSRMAAVGPFEPDEVNGRIGQLFMTIEKTMSVAEPVAARHPLLSDAFATTPSCQFVVQ